MGGWSWFSRTYPGGPVVNPTAAEAAAASPPVALSAAPSAPPASSPIAPATPLTGPLPATSAVESSEPDISAPQAATRTSATPSLTEAPAETTQFAIARLRRNLSIVSAGIIKRTDPSGFVDVVAVRVNLNETHPLLALLLVSFTSEDQEASVQWRIAIDGEPGAGTVVGRPVVAKAQAVRKPKILTVYGTSVPLDPGEHSVRIQASSDRPTALSIRPAASDGSDSMRLIVFELL